MSNRNIVKLAIAQMDAVEWGSDAYEVARYAVAKALSPGHYECLRQIMKAPVWDGDICSKAARGELFDFGLATRVCFKNEQGYTAATYRAYTILTALDNEDDLPPWAKSDSDGT
jgi:hypothetical protein